MFKLLNMMHRRQKKRKRENKDEKKMRLKLLEPKLRVIVFIIYLKHLHTYGIKHE